MSDLGVAIVYAKCTAHLDCVDCQRQFDLVIISRDLLRVRQRQELINDTPARLVLARLDRADEVSSLLQGALWRLCRILLRRGKSASCPIPFSRLSRNRMIIVSVMCARLHRTSARRLCGSGASRIAATLSLDRPIRISPSKHTRPLQQQTTALPLLHNNSLADANEDANSKTHPSFDTFRAA